MGGSFMHEGVGFWDVGFMGAVVEGLCHEFRQ